MRNALLAAVISLLAVGPATAEVRGMAGVPDGDLLSVAGQRFRLFGIDAVELHQFCYIDGKAWACGPVAIRTLEVMVALEPVTCRETGEAAGAEMLWALCSVGGRDISEAMVRAGMALANRAQSDAYVAAEEAARTQGVGIWKSRFIEPWVFRADMRAVEDRVAERQRIVARDQLDRALIEGNGGIQILQGFRIVRSGADTVERAVTVDEIKRDFITKTISAEDAFDWRVPAQEIVNWRDTTFTAAFGQAVRLVWAGLEERPRRVIEVNDAATYLRAVEENSAPWIMAGRQPILLVPSSSEPAWLGQWLSGELATPGVQVSRKDDVKFNQYLGTINGVDVYDSELPLGQALMFPDDMLEEVRYGTNAEGRVVTITFEEGVDPAPGRLTFHLSQGLTWKGDEVVDLRFPFEPPAEDYE